MNRCLNSAINPVDLDVLKKKTLPMNNKATDKNIAKIVDQSNWFTPLPKVIIYEKKGVLLPSKIGKVHSLILNVHVRLWGMRIRVFCVNLVAKICRKQM